MPPDPAIPAAPPAPPEPPMPASPDELEDAELVVLDCVCLALQAANVAPIASAETIKAECVMRMLERLVTVFIECLTRNYESV